MSIRRGCCCNDSPCTYSEILVTLSGVTLCSDLCINVVPGTTSRLVQYSSSTINGSYLVPVSSQGLAYCRYILLFGEVGIRVQTFENDDCTGAVLIDESDSGSLRIDVELSNSGTVSQAFLNGPILGTSNLPNPTGSASTGFRAPASGRDAFDINVPIANTITTCPTGNAAGTGFAYGGTVTVSIP